MRTDEKETEAIFLVRVL